MKRTHEQNEQGSILLEVVAVLAILAIIAPIIFQQAMKRNVEISNINIASEIRSIKEATQAYITATCPSNTLPCTLIPGDIAHYLPDGLEDAIDHYEIAFCAYTVGDINAGTDCSATTLTSSISGNQAKRRYALIADVVPPVQWNLRRAKRVASLVGTDGGVCMGNNIITGVNGAWTLTHPCTTNNVIVHTGLNIWQ